MKLRQLCLILSVLAGAFSLQPSAQESDLVLPGQGTRNAFGTMAGTDISGNGHLATGAEFVVEQGASSPSPSGVTIFVQGNATFSANMPRAAKNMIAIAQKDFVAVYTADGLMAPKVAKGTSRAAPDGTQLPDMIFPTPDAGIATFYLRIRDSRSGLWVNPALFVKDFSDQRAPRIESVQLSGTSGRFVMPDSRKVASRMPQGEYSLAVRAVDPWGRTEASSGIFRWKVLLDGLVLSDRKLDAARITADGLDFMELGAPSGRLVSGSGGLMLGTTFLAKGNHVLRITAYDFSGNYSDVEWKFIVQ